MPNLLESVYVVLVVAYATLATTSWMFTSLEQRAEAAHRHSIDLSHGGAAYLWTEQRDRQNPQRRSIRDDFERLCNKPEGWAKRWDFAQWTMFVSVLVASVVALFVQLHDFHVLPESTTPLLVFMILCSQFLASASVPLVGVNLVVLSQRLRQRESLKHRLMAICLPVGVMSQGGDGIPGAASAQPSVGGSNGPAAHT